MDIKTRLTRCCGKPIGGDNCREGLRCSDCFDKLEGLREIERLQSINDDAMEINARLRDEKREANAEIERFREALDEAETICLAQYVMLMCAGENEKASYVKKVADKFTFLLKKETE